MELINVLESTAVAVMTAPPAVQLFAPDLARALQERYRFVEAPKSAADFQAEMSLRYGYFNDFIIGLMTVYNDGLLVQGPASTDKLDVLVRDVFGLLGEQFGMPEQLELKPTLYSSKIEVRLNSNLSAMFPATRSIATELKGLVEKYGVAVDGYELRAFTLFSDGDGDVKPGRFLIEPRANRGTSDNIFFSEAPLSTEQHLMLLTELDQGAN